MRIIWNTKVIQEEQEDLEHRTALLSILCFIAYYLGRYSHIVKLVFKTAAIIAALYALIHFTGISIEVKRSEKTILNIK